MSAIERASQWWIGDWLRYGAARWGEKYAQAARITGYDVPSLRNMAWLASQFDVSRRRDDLSWSHHAAVAGCDRVEQDRWLSDAARRRLSVADLRFEIRSARRGRLTYDERQEQLSAVGRDTCPTCGQRLPGEGEQQMTSADTASRAIAR